MKKFKIENSPFIVNNNKSLKVYHEEINDIDEDFILVKKKYYQSSEYVKLIINTEVELSKYFKLGKTAKDILYYIVNILEYNSPTFKLKVETLELLLNKSTASLYRGIKELIINKYIAKTNIKEVYWINHNYYYKGNYTFEHIIKTKNKHNKDYEPTIFKKPTKD